jgi:hypothetical protein
MDRLSRELEESPLQIRPLESSTRLRSWNELVFRDNLRQTRKENDHLFQELNTVSKRQTDVRGKVASRSIKVGLNTSSSRAGGRAERVPNQLDMGSMNR